MKCLLRNLNAPFCLTVVAFGSLVTAAQAADEFNIDNRTEVTSQTVSGAGAASSFLAPGTHILHETDLRWNGQAFDGQWNSRFNSTLRYTDSNQFDPERFSLQKLEWRLSDAKNRLDFGDYFANLSPYAMTKGIKGVAVQRNLDGDQNYVRVFYGSFHDQWAYVLGDPSRTPMETRGGGLRVQRAWDKLRVGFNLAEAHDLKDDAHASFPAYSQTLPAVDWEYREAGLVVTGEHAFSETDIVAAAGGPTNRRSGSAHKLAFRGALRDLSLDAQAERVATDFISRGGGATADRLRYYLKADYKMARDWRIFATYDEYSDNLDSQKIATTDVATQELGFKKARAFGRRYMNTALSWRAKTYKLNDGSADQITNRVKFKINDRVAEDYDWRVEVERILDKDRVRSFDAGSTLFDLGLSYRSRASEKWSIRADADFGRQENGSLGVAGADVNERLRLALNADRGDGNVFGVSVERNTADLVAPLADNRHLRNSIYWQSKPAFIKDGSMKLEYTDFVHRFVENPVNDYREQILKLTLVWNFQNGVKK